MPVADNNRYRIAIDHSYRFGADEIMLTIVQKSMEGYRPVTLTCTVGDEIIQADPYVAIQDKNYIANAFPIELARSMLNAFSRYFLSSEGDLVATVERQKRELERVTSQLENLISGIGRLGGNSR